MLVSVFAHDKAEIGLGNFWKDYRNSPIHIVQQISCENYFDLDVSHKTWNSANFFRALTLNAMSENWQIYV